MVGKVREWIVTISQQAIQPAGQSGNRLLQIARSSRANLKTVVYVEFRAAIMCMPVKVAITKRVGSTKTGNERPEVLCRLFQQRQPGPRLIRFDETLVARHYPGRISNAVALVQNAFLRHDTPESDQLRSCIIMQTEDGETGLSPLPAPCY